MEDIDLKNTIQTSSQKNLKLKILTHAKKFFILSTSLLIIWLVGYFQINPLFICIGVIIFIIYRSSMKQKSDRFLFGCNLSLDEKATINHFSNLPSWVFFPDIERVEWINKIITRLWPSISKYTREQLLDKILPKLKKSFHNQLKVKEINLGDSPPKIGGIKFYDNDYLNRVEMTVDIELYFYGNGEFKFSFNNVSFGVNHLEIKAKLRLQLSNFVPKPPFVGAVTMTLLDNPRINFDYTDAAVFLNMPGINNILRETITDTISQIIVIPNRIPITFIRNIDIRQLIFPIPEGMIRIHIIEGAALKASDTNLIGKNTSDPYVIIRVGAEKFKSQVIDKNLNPKWNEYFEAVVDTKSCQKIEFQVYDKDLKNKDDFLGEVFVDVENVYGRGFIDEWLSLQKVNTGTIHVHLTWLNLSSNVNIFDIIEEKNKKIDSPLNVAFLYFSLDCAKNLRKINYDDIPSPYAEITLGNKHKSTSVISKSQNPIWENAFHFTLLSIYSSDLKVEIKDEKSKKLLGSFSLPIVNLLNYKEMETTQTVSLQNTDGKDSTLTFYAALRALEPLERRRSSSSVSKISSPNSPDPVKSKIKSIPEEIPADFEINNNLINDDNKAVRQEVSLDWNENSDLDTSIDASPITKVKLRKNSLISDISDNDKSGPLVNVTIRYSNKMVFYIVIHKVNNLVVINEKNPNIYIKLSLVQENGKMYKWSTKAVPYNLTMTYDETFQLLIEKDNLRRGTFSLDFKVERQFAFNNKKIGCSEINLKDWDLSSISKWYPIEMKVSKHSTSFSRLSIRSKSPN